MKKDEKQLLYRKKCTINVKNWILNNNLQGKIVIQNHKNSIKSDIFIVKTANFIKKKYKFTNNIQTKPFVYPIIDIKIKILNLVKSKKYIKNDFSIAKIV